VSSSSKKIKKEKKFIGNKTEGKGLGHQERNDQREDEASLALAR